ncbi:MAG: archaellin/type IV pilin N-terminal domain-containing protein, partial [Thermoproteota archaeon]|nr:archaellin/type IV pilin N-terminal domain-containing protein [Thermoproteota archaeon]
MKKLLKTKKGLSPVIAAIILIAVTVAVSIAVAAWMGALTFTFMKTEELKITGIVWKYGTDTYANLT